MKGKRNGFRNRILCLALTGILGFSLILGGCNNQKGGGEGGAGSNGIFTNRSDLPEDTPWNHGTSAIMETEKGWYTTGVGEKMCRRYYDKETKESIILCNKPECMHEGDDACEATYRNLKVVNACLYEGYIYLLGWEGICNDSGDFEERDIPETEIADSVNLSLYRAALDGSAIDKVGTVFETDNMQHQRVYRTRRTAGVLGLENEDSSFIIHKGVAYISVYLILGGGSVGLRAAGLYKMDLQTGALKEIEKYETLQSRPPAYLTGVSDAVYYLKYDTATRKQTWYRYLITEDRVEIADPLFSDEDEKNEAFGKKFMKLDALPYFTAERSYWLVRSYQESDNGVLAILAVDAKTQAIVAEESFETGIEFSKKKYRNNPRNNGYYFLTHYDGKFVIATVENVYLLDEKGNKVGEVPIPREELHMFDQEKQIRLDFKISNGQIYLIFGNGTDDIGLGGTGFYHVVMRCPLESIEKGQADWTRAYRMQGVKTFIESLQERIEEIIGGVPENLRDEQKEYYDQMLRETYPEEFK